MIKNWHILISGFLQSEAERTGLEDLWLEMGALRAADTVVALKPWRADWRGLAKHMERVSDKADVIIQVYAYSWGAGYGFPSLARELARRGLKIRHAVLSDPVWKPRLWVLSWLALTRWGVIRVPGNVGGVNVFVQRRNRPWGRRVVIENGTGPKRVATMKTLHGYVHGTMDEAAEFHARAMEVAREIH